MAQTIYKYPLPFPRGVMTLPGDARPLTVQMQGPTPTLWARVTPAYPQKTVIVQAYGTGHPLPNVGNLGDYLGTVQFPDGTVWHYHLID